jgi:trehalose 6-phosphate phosphatase
VSEQKWVDRLAAASRRGADLAVFFDYDGTLTPIVSHPSLARLAPEMRQRMRSLATLDRVRVGVVSSRALNELRLLVGLPGLYYAGSAGMEIDLLGHHVFDP